MFRSNLHKYIHQYLQQALPEAYAVKANAECTDEETVQGFWDAGRGLVV